MPAALDAIDPFDPAILVDSVAYDRRLRREAPVLRHAASGVHLVSSHAGVLEVLTDRDRFSSRTGPVPGGGFAAPPGGDPDDPLFAAFREQSYPLCEALFANDPPDHDRFRSAAGDALAPERTGGGGAELLERCRGLIDGFAERGVFEVRADYAAPLAIAAVAGPLGVPEADRGRLARWAAGFTAPLTGEVADEEPLDGLRRMLEFQHYFAVRIDEARRAPGDDIVSRLAAAGPTGASLELPELLSLLHQLLVAGPELIAGAVTESVWQLVSDPEMGPRLEAAPDRRGAFLEETLRLSPPVKALWRRTRGDTRLGGVAIPDGSLLLLRLGSANRDEAVFPDPDRIDLARSASGDPLTFAAGIHQCLGVPLARTALDAAFQSLLERLTELRPAHDRPEPRRTPSVVLGGAREVHVAFTPRWA